MNETLVLMSTSTAVFLAVACVISLGTDLIFQDDARIEERLRQEFQSPEKQNQQKSPLFRDLTMLQSHVGNRNILRSLWSSFAIHVEQTGFTWSAERIVGIGVAVSTLLGSIGYIVTDRLIVVVAMFLLGLITPFLVIEYCWHRRRKILCEQLPDAFDQIRRSIRAGLPLIKAMQQIAVDFPPPISDEFEMCCQKQGLGLPQSVAMQELARRINIMELQLFVVTVQIQRDIGGNTAEILGKLSQVVRQRFRLASRIKSLTAEGRMQALVLGALPLVAGGFMMLINPPYIQVLLDRPQLLAGLFVSELIGAVWIRKIVTINY